MTPLLACEVEVSHPTAEGYSASARRIVLPDGLRRIILSAVAGVGLALLVVTLGGCVGGMVGYSGYDDGDDGPAFDYGTDFYEPGGFDYGGWGAGYFGGPPAYGYRGGRDYGHRGDHGDNHGNDGGFGHGDRHGNGGGGHGSRPYRAAPQSHGIPSIPRGPRGDGMRGGGGGHH